MACPKGCCVDYKTHIQGINIGSFPTYDSLREAKLDRDMCAYKRLVDDGLNPPTVDGAHAIEQNARSVREVELGHAIDPETASIMDEAGI